MRHWTSQEQHLLASVNPEVCNSRHSRLRGTGSAGRLASKALFSLGRRPCQATAIKSAVRLGSSLAGSRHCCFPPSSFPCPPHSPDPCQNREELGQHPQMAITAPTVLQQVMETWLLGRRRVKGVAVPPVITHLWQISLFPMRGSLALEPTGSWAKAGSGPRRAVRLEEEGRRTDPGRIQADGVRRAACEVSA